MLAGFSGFALVLARGYLRCDSYSVQQRTKEIGIRQRSVHRRETAARICLRHYASPLSGWARLALAGLTRSLGSLLFGVSGTIPHRSPGRGVLVVVATVADTARSTRGKIDPIQLSIN